MAGFVLGKGKRAEEGRDEPRVAATLQRNLTAVQSTNHCEAVYIESKWIKISVFSAFWAGFCAQEHRLYPFALVSCR